MDEYPDFLWQREYNRRWANYSSDDCILLNKAFTKKQKTVTLPSKDPKKKLIVNIEKMYQKNLISGFEQRVRCLVYNGNDNLSWSWKDDYGNFMSYSPNVVLYLEVAFTKKLAKVCILLKDEYEIDLNRFTQENKSTGNVREVMREIIYVTFSNITDSSRAVKQNIKCKDIIRQISTKDDQSIKKILFGLPLSRSEGETDLQIPLIDNESITESQASATSSVAVDPHCPEANLCHVYCEGTNIYSAILNLANLQDNNNKFYNMQLLEYNNKKKYAVWFHWGRLGYTGQSNLQKFNGNLDAAKSSFEKKFYDKTRNNFTDGNFQRVPGKYDLVETDLSSRVTPTARQIVESTLDKKIQNLLEVICNKKTLEEAAKEMSYDAKATPLGKITAKQLKEGYIALRDISKILQTQGVGKELIEACNTFYTKIPHDFGRKTPPILHSKDDIKEKLKMLEDLSNICLAMNVMESNQGIENPIDVYYRRLECTLIPLDNNSEEFHALNKCLKETHGPSHSYTLSIIDAYKCSKENHEKDFVNFGKHKMLWHGSRISNWMSILKEGLRIAPPEAPSTGYMFGKGIYFADISSKSANYCYATKKQNEGILLLSEVSLGNSLTAYEAEDLSNLPDEFQSVFAVGKITPTFERNVLSSQALVPCGPLEERSNEDLTLNYNEYVVYNVHQVKMKYLIRIKFDF